MATQGETMAWLLEKDEYRVALGYRAFSSKGRTGYRIVAVLHVDEFYDLFGIAAGEVLTTKPERVDISFKLHKGV